MADTIKIGCPQCGSVLLVNPVPGIETKTVTCPICKTKNTFTAYRKIIDQEDPTLINSGTNYTIGTLQDPATGRTYQLRPGRNVIGRQAPTSKADIQLPCQTKRMSREHIVIDVKKIPGTGYRHCAALYKEHVNQTAVNRATLEYGDSIVLNTHDTIHLPDYDLTFHIPDEDETEKSTL